MFDVLARAARISLAIAAPIPAISHGVDSFRIRARFARSFLFWRLARARRRTKNQPCGQFALALSEYP
jgi:hypothetical protein